MEPSFQHPRSGEWAHDRRDPLREARCTFVEPIFEVWGGPLHPSEIAAGNTKRLRLLEIGFGRGLNTAMALRLLAEHGYAGPIDAHGCEPNPQFLQPWPQVPSELNGYAPWWGYTAQEFDSQGQADHAQAWEQGEQTTIRLHLVTAATLLAALEPESVDWIFLDLFSPAKHGQDWEPDLWHGLKRVAAPQAVLTSYSCARRVRDGLQSVGWHCEVLRRPNYRDTLRARLLAPEAGNA